MFMDVSAVGGTQIAIGLSAITKITPAAYQRSGSLKIVSGAGTLWISPFPIALSGASAVASMAAGYPVGATEVITLPAGATTFYMHAAAATMTVGIAFGYSSGVSMSV